MLEPFQHSRRETILIIERRKKSKSLLRKHKKKQRIIEKNTVESKKARKRSSKDAGGRLASALILPSLSTQSELSLGVSVRSHVLAVLADVECRYSSARRRLSSSSVEPLRRESKIIGRFMRGEGRHMQRWRRREKGRRGG